ncbi:UPF0389 protein CG9231 isoform X2 [Phymastichus coffea]|nr:UPF0389 protein CG9231 isoform X2 [Phymastichus coffea]XP_058792052.1 UPF0389 protein CG9231 isoform X2 [Phymastichus coffea]XP_058792053.1 UPF0389 protein CG9231 isoform X2 [Phymastichus coffea]
MLMPKAFFHCWKTALSRRFISQSTRNFESKISDTSKVSSSGATSSSSNTNGSASIIGSRMMAPSAFDKWILVWMKKYPKGQVPDRIKEEVIYQTKSRARIKIANYMIAISVIMCIGAAISGRKARKDGDSLHQRNIDWHKKVNEEHTNQLATKS